MKAIFILVSLIALSIIYIFFAFLYENVQGIKNGFGCLGLLAFCLIVCGRWLEMQWNKTEQTTPRYAVKNGDEFDWRENV